MKQWRRVLTALLLAACCMIVSSIVATPRAQAAGTQEMWVNCSVFFSDGPNQGDTEPVSFLTTSNGGLTAYGSTYVGGQSEPGAWFSNGTNTTGFTFSAALTTPPDTTLTVNATFTDNTYPVSAAGTGTIVDSTGATLVVTHTTTTCPYFLPGTSGCSITITGVQRTGVFTDTVEIFNTTSSAISIGGTLLFVFPGTQTLVNGWNGVYSQNGSTVTVSNLLGIPARGSIFTSFNGDWSGSNPTPVEFALNTIPCSVNM
jgi:xyloglucan-specific exo-beta-1,4-glucanase